jgi:hypothetical protein
MAARLLQSSQVPSKFRWPQMQICTGSFPAEPLQILHRGIPMSISGFLSNTFNLQPPAGATSPYQQQLQQLSQALTSGNLSAAQSDFATLQKAFTQSSTTGSGSSSPSANPVTQAFNQLASDLQSGNLAAARKDFSTLKQDAKTYGAPPTSHSWGFNKLNGGSSPADPIEQNSLLQSLTQIGQSSSSTNQASAQQAYASLQQEFQQFALGSEDASELSNLPVSLVA